MYIPSQTSQHRVPFEVLTLTDLLRSQLQRLVGQRPSGQSDVQVRVVPNGNGADTVSKMSLALRFLSFTTLDINAAGRRPATRNGNDAAHVPADAPR